ncbi:Purine catabolism regulatory protein [Sporomusa rhizae]|uniref:PucR family transcriptional regulator n=1 Tax=Sporomusa rhizae TaxID=357999 RepID=UPI00352A7033
MDLTIKDVLQLFKEQAMFLSAGSAGLNNPVKSVNIMDAPDIGDWAKTGDLILTTAYTIKDDIDLQEQLIRALHARGCAGLGIKTKRFLQEIPPTIQALANELGFPLLELPLSLSFAEIINPVICSIASRQSYLLQRSNEIHKTLTDVAINGGGLNAIVTNLGKLTQCPAGCFDINGQLINHWMPDNLPGHDSNTLHALEHLLLIPEIPNNILQKKLSRTKNPYTHTITLEGASYQSISCAIMSSNEFFGHITIILPDNNFTDIKLVALEHACTVAALDFLKQKAIAENRKLHSRDMLEYILFGNPNEQNTADIITNSKLAQARRYKCLVIETETTATEVNWPILSAQLCKISQQIIAETFPLSLISERTGKIIALVAAMSSFNNEQNLYNNLHHALATSFENLTVSIGIGTQESDIMAARRSFHVALTSLNIGRVTKGAGHIVQPYEIACYHILSDPETTVVLSQICHPIISKLEHIDNTTESEFLKTLERYLESDKNLTETAKELYIHRNTLSNRLDRIVDLTGLDLQNRELLFCLRLALRQRKILPIVHT